MLETHANSYPFLYLFHVQVMVIRLITLFGANGNLTIYDAFGGTTRDGLSDL